MRHQVWIVLAALLLALLPLGAATASTTKPAVKADNKADFTAVSAAVQNEMRPGGRYEFLDSAEHDTVLKRLSDMQALFDSYGTVAQMDSNTRAQLLTDQEDVNAILTRRDDRRMVCKSERPVGSLIPQQACRTYGEIERARRGTQEFMQQQARPGYVSGAGGPPSGH
jgi:hypothetical protein